MPDGCRDLIVKSRRGMAPVSFVTDLADRCDMVDVQAGDGYDGFRLRPGVQIDQLGLMASMEGGLTDTAIKDRLDNFVVDNPAVSEALACLSDAKAGIGKAAADLGVQPRSLQRLVLHKTGKTPVFWMRLARVRRAAVRTMQSESLADLAYDMGYADQSHMTREFRHWLGTTPHQIRRDADSLYLGLGYGA